MPIQIHCRPCHHGIIIIPFVPVITGHGIASSPAGPGIKKPCRHVGDVPAGFTRSNLDVYWNGSLFGDVPDAFLAVLLAKFQCLSEVDAIRGYVVVPLIVLRVGPDA